MISRIHSIFLSKYTSKQAQLFVLMTTSIQVGKDFFCGCVSGWGVVTAAMPFENIKLKMQAKPQEYNKGYLASVTKTIKEQGLLAFYKGSLVPFIGVGFLLSVQFGVVESVKKIYRKSNERGKDRVDPLYSYYGGFLSGIPCALIVTPQDHARFRVALRKEKGVGSVGMVIQLLREFGLRTTYRGFVPCLLRDTFGSALWYGLYDTFIHNFKDEEGKVNIFGSLLCGSISGLMYWIPLYPIDYVKTLLQSDSLLQPKYQGMTDCFRQSYAKGIGTFYTGVGLVILRSVITSPISFACFELAKRLVY